MISWAKRSGAYPPSVFTALGIENMNLNGWTRFWIVLTSLWFLAVGSYAYSVWPDTTNIDKEFVNEVYAIINEFNGKNNNIRITDIIAEANLRGLLKDSEAEKDKLARNENWLELANYKISNSSETVNFDKAIRKHSRQTEIIEQNKSSLLKQGFLFGAIPPAFIFLLGLSIGWIRKGFKNT